MKPVRTVIFAKAPLPGLAKTRLIPALGAQGAADLARRMLLRAVQEAYSANLGPIELCVTPAPTEPVWRTLPLPAALQWTEQGQGDLGERMARAAQRVLDCGEAVLLTGTDCPGLKAAQLQQAAGALRCCDATLVPAFDGGYVLLGLKRFHRSLFEGIAWSTDSVAKETVQRLKQLEWSVQHLPMLHDIDQPEDLKWL
ncbi:MAG: TIGR04282 family arsenosugar biosynthesis glycosyltransferase [Rhodoferax sp.]|uniref:TIGR04282 family arsenosugar biosynthesis glycosyltransferase n=1 Tax=Rhodoferax sp. TaxID=50421 RepID=UPI002635122E|nr:TIGR04282 family arsenosugar biosynthesis glycosyltransferase [Rhodoferax sp.]MDD5332264.1 TIGR04282 family arsenosugar biosynthesis glycosyltransferase [Rhodoferax sp.]